MKKFFYLLALCAMTMVSCEKWFGDDEPKKQTQEPTETPETPGDDIGEEPGDEPNDEPNDDPNQGTEQPEQPEIEFQLTSDTVVELSCDGGMFVITYAITNPDENLAVDVDIKAGWISLTDALDATPNQVKLYAEANQSVEPRSAEVVVTYGEFKANVLVNQAADERLLPYLSGIYYGDYYGAGYNYTVVLSTAQNVLDVVTGDYYLAEGHKYLFIDLFSAEPSAEYNVKFNVPAGEYLFDVDNTAMAGSVGAEYTYFYDATAEGEQVSFVGGNVVVAENFIEATMMGADGVEYYFYTNTASVDNTALFKGNGMSCELSTLAEDLVIDFASPSLYAECYYDYYVVGKDLWVLYIDDYATGHSLAMELLTPMGEAPVGKFEVSSDLAKERLALPGFADGYGETWWSWYYLYDGYDVVGMAPVVSGSLEIVDDGTGTHTATFSFKEDKGYTISGSCTAYFETYGDVSVLSAKRHTAPSRK